MYQNKIFLVFSLLVWSSCIQAVRYSNRDLSFTSSLEATSLKDSTSLKSFVPGSKASNFQIWTLNHGIIEYPSPKLPADAMIGFHSFTNHSGFLECMWTNIDSLQDFINTSPSTAYYIFMTFDSNAVEIVSWMRSQLVKTLPGSKLSMKEQQDFLARCYFVITPVNEIGNWISSLLSDWSCTDHGCGFNQLVYQCDIWQPQIMIGKRVDARYDWAMNHNFSPSTLNLQLDSSSLCHLNATMPTIINGSVILIPFNITQCSVAQQVYNLQKVGAAGVLVYSQPGFPLHDINCKNEECNNAINIPVSSVPFNSKLNAALLSKLKVMVSQQTTPSPNFYFTINPRGELVEPGWFLYPSLQFLAWQMQWLEFDDNLVNRISHLNDYVVTIFNKTVMQGKQGTGNVSITFDKLSNYDQIYLDAALSCTSDRDEGCPPWDHVPQLFMCCDGASLCNVEIGRWITAFRRGIGHWLTDISPLLPLFMPSHSISKCTFLMKSDAWWAQPWVATLQLRFQKSSFSQLPSASDSFSPPLLVSSTPLQVLPLFQGGVFNQTYNSKYYPISFEIPAYTTSVSVFAVITGHGSDNNGCGEFCVTSHHFVVNGKHQHVKTFSNAATPLGCADRVPQGVVPNEHGTWLYGRDGWCDGQQVEPWVFDITSDLQASNNSISYFGWFDGKDPNPTENPGVIRLVSYLVFYTGP